jgi:hypothetical protein
MRRLACGAVTAMNRAAGVRHDAMRDVALASQTLAAAQLLERHIVRASSASASPSRRVRSSLRLAGAPLVLLSGGCLVCRA